MTILLSLITVFAFALSGTILQRRLPGTLRASERFAVTIIAVYLQFQLSLTIPGLLGILQPVWVAFTAILLTAFVLIVCSKFLPEPMLKLPEGVRHNQVGLRWSAIALLALVSVWAVYAWFQIFLQPLTYNDRTIYLSRAIQWIQEHRIFVSVADDARAIATPLPANFTTLFHLLFFRTDFAIGLWNLLAWLVCGLAVYIAAQRWLKSRSAGLIAAATVLLAPSMLVLTNGIASAGWEIAFAIIGLHFLAHGKQRPQHAVFAHTVAAISLGCSAALQLDLPISILIFVVLLIVFRPSIQRRIVLRNFGFFLILSGWSHLLVWIQCGNPIAPQLSDIFGITSGKINPTFHAIIGTPGSFVSLTRIAARLSSAILPVPLSPNDAVLNIGAAALLTGLSGFILISMRNEKSWLRDPLTLGLILMSLVSIIIAPSLLWRETPIVAPVVLCGLGAGCLFKSIAHRKIESVLSATIPTIITIVFAVVAAPSLQPIGTNSAIANQIPRFLKSFALPDRVAVYSADWFDTWTLRQPLIQPRTIVPLDPELSPDRAFRQAARNGCEWLVVTDSPLHRYRMPVPYPIPKGWDVIDDERIVLYDSPGWLRIVVFRHDERTIAASTIKNSYVISNAENRKK